MSTDSASSIRGAGATIAASSPTPRRTEAPRVVITDDAAPQRIEIGLVGALVTGACRKIAGDSRCRAACELSLVESLQHELARAAARVSLHRSRPADSRSRARPAPLRSPW